MKTIQFISYCTEGFAFAGRTKESCDYTVAATSSDVSPYEVATSTTISAMRYELSALADLDIHYLFALCFVCQLFNESDIARELHTTPHRLGLK